MTITADISPDQLSNFVLRSWVEFQNSDEAVLLCTTHSDSNTDGIAGILRCAISGTVYYPGWNNGQNDGHIFAVANLASLPTSRYETFKGNVNFTFKCLSSELNIKTLGSLKFIIALDDVR